MSPRDEILSQALALPPEDRAYVAGVLEESLHVGTFDLPVDEAHEGSADDSVTGAEFAAELRRRSAAYRDGTSSARDAAEVLEELRQRQANETRP